MTYIKEMEKFFMNYRHYNRDYDREYGQGNNDSQHSSGGNNHNNNRHKRKRRMIIIIALFVVLLLIIIPLCMAACSSLSDGDAFNQSSSDSSGDTQQQQSQPSSLIAGEFSGEDPLAGLSSDDQPSSNASNSDDKPDYGNNPNVTNSIGEYQSSETSEMLRLVNFYNRLPSDFEPEITEINGGRKFSVLAAEALDQMIEDCNLAMGETQLWAQSTYRSYETQTKLYEKEIEEWEADGMTREEAEKKAATIVAIPGTSEHNTGLCCDFNTVSSDFADTQMYTWLIEHCHEYGFVERYPEDKQDITGIIWEPWHYRYVGIEAATEMKQNDWCLEEYHYYKGL